MPSVKKFSVPTVTGNSIGTLSRGDFTTISAGRLAVRYTARKLSYSRHDRTSSSFFFLSIGSLGGAKSRNGVQLRRQCPDVEI